jgi:membrane associated rhomboid family serine protease
VVFVLCVILTGSQRAGWLSPYNWGIFNIDEAIHGGQVWRFVTYQFLHAGLFHIFFNMLALYFFGPMAERWWGSRRYLAFYLLCGIGGAAFLVLLAFAAPGLIFRSSQDPMAVGMLGASGCVFGVLICAARVAPDTRVMLLIPPIPMKLRTMVYIFLGIAMLSVLVGSSNAGGEAGHLGGAAMGFLLIRNPRWLNIFARLPRPRLGQRLHEAADNRRLQRNRDREDQVDRILRKIHEHGLASLTDREKRILSQATESKRGR